MALISELGRYKIVWHSKTNPAYKGEGQEYCLTLDQAKAGVKELNRKYSYLYHGYRSGVVETKNKGE